MSESDASAKDHVVHEGLGSHKDDGLDLDAGGVQADKVIGSMDEPTQASANLRVINGLFRDAAKKGLREDNLADHLELKSQLPIADQSEGRIEEESDATDQALFEEESDGRFYALSLLDHERGSLSPDEEMTRYKDRIRTLTTFTPFRSPKQRLQQGAEMYPERPADDGIEPESYEQAIAQYRKPKTLVSCLRIGMGQADQPCPFLSCQGHMYSEDARKSWRLQGPHYFDDGDPVPSVIFKGPTCSYREFNVEHTLEEIGTNMWITRERIRQIEERAMLKIRSVANMEESEFLPQLTQSAESIQKTWLGSIWTSERGGRRWMIIEFGDNKAKMMPVDSDGVPVSVNTETLARSFKLVFNGDSPESAAEIIRGMEKKQLRRESRSKELVNELASFEANDPTIGPSGDPGEDACDER